MENTTINSASSVSFQNIKKIYPGNTTAVENLSFIIEAGTLVTLLGPSGCGKTTTLRIIAGLETVSTGKIFIGDEEVTKLPANERDISMVFQSYALFPHMKVWENVAYGPQVTGMKKAKARDLAYEGLDLVGLKSFAERWPNQLSGGQQQRVAVARSLVLKPKVLLFDEPLSNLDAKLRRRMREDIRDIQRKLNLTAVYVTHDQEEALAVSDKIIIMNKGNISQIGSPREIYESPASLFVADFIGDANIVDAKVLSINENIAQVALGTIRLTLPCKADNKAVKPGRAKLAIRPEAIKLLPSAKQNIHKKEGLHGKVLKATYIGNSMEYSLESKLGELFVVSSNVTQPFKENDEVFLHFADHGVILLAEE